ncbi:hypothetical protein K7Z75_21930 [Mycobacterium avium subsp. hominissuis]|uniref:Uncharacterized protein n=1 Tax=Mycobacterium bouchedurhonense TaxID=701041 RepID=A0AAW5RXX2_MYCBC|nr:MULTISPECIES: hypothetical protein [Mycobacterium avium complex (MAC)]MCV6988135.1 hypothetical protein [Mycobacterium bouchedurhonense]MDV3306302.1 hypothetical protein [Mycobacterium avium subsp. hominissuis]ORA42158.1 hypothetical protein BST19_26135 [Mycobacterium bouchedurhonense]
MVALGADDYGGQDDAAGCEGILLASGSCRPWFPGNEDVEQDYFNDGQYQNDSKAHRRGSSPC